MVVRFWLIAFETWAVTQLLRSPTFHSLVRKSHRQIHRIRHGTPLEELGGTKRDGEDASTLAKYFLDELKDQAGIKSKGKK